MGSRNTVKRWLLCFFIMAMTGWGCNSHMQNLWSIWHLIKSCIMPPVLCRYSIYSPWASTCRVLLGYWSAHKELEVADQTTQCEVFSVRGEQVPGGTSLSPRICVIESTKLTSHCTCSDPLIVLWQSLDRRLETSVVKRSQYEEQHQRGQAPVRPSLACAVVCMCVRRCACMSADAWDSC